jgi:pyruvate dehydrogenase E1 component
VILAHTKKGYGMGSGRPGQDDHAQPEEAGRRGAAGIPQPLQPAALGRAGHRLAFFKPAEDSAEMRYLHERAPRWAATCRSARPRATWCRCRTLGAYAQFALQAAGKEMSTTMAFVRLLGNLLKDPHAGPAHRAHRGRRGAHLRHGQPVQAGRHLFERGPELRAGGHRLGAVVPRSADGQILEEGISEAGAIASWTAAATSYSVHGLAMLPFYIYYSMFGFQRVGDAIWAAADQRARGFLLGATSGRTTLAAKACSTRTAAATWWPRPSRTARPTTRPSPARWR